MQKTHSKIAKGVSDEMVWMLEHPPVYTGGTSATKNDLLKEILEEEGYKTVIEYNSWEFDKEIPSNYFTTQYVSRLK